jgi:hypothetical protein
MEKVASIDYFLDWIRIRFMEIEVTKVASVMTELFRKCGRRSDQSVREFNLEYERLLMHLRELGCELPPLVKAWLYLDKLRLPESEEMNILSSVSNKYDLKLLQQAAFLHDRPTRRPAGGWEKGDVKPRWNRQSTVHLTGIDENEDSDGAFPDLQEGRDKVGSDEELVTEEIATNYHDAFMAFQDAKSKYREAVKGRGFDREEHKKRAEERLRAAKARSYIALCIRGRGTGIEILNVLYVASFLPRPLLTHLDGMVMRKVFSFAMCIWPVLVTMVQRTSTSRP